ncbi:MAG: type II toxin-antitoxin system VapC family toxin [Drouetiella hepatica Uher 2000/2452]|jgi:PIN domain nuclease of toxin-antitoxin system|uniref:Type II toxin-antitoxin system VapC family toxin n=1 Tax=Drouetiella hepatica Uher 2000/2452 TaxID=904376 RepID=A0A951UPP6_9CYAN|nr:type II toxin-antitoxin system VapC family toxin [Drouetiella hepatica Uher 2000/2452]
MSAFLLDTHTFIWLTENDSNLPDNLRITIDTADLVYFSIVSLWEIAIKLKLGKLFLQQSYETIGSAIDVSDILILPIAFADTVQVRNLPLHHSDPFDRMLISQAINHSLAIISTDKKFDAYSVQRVWA